LDCGVQTNDSPTCTIPLENVSKPKAKWQKGMENQVTNLNDILSALCSDMKEMYKLMLADQEGKKCSNFKHG
jgi:hypothetical protein